MFGLKRLAHEYGCINVMVESILLRISWFSWLHSIFVGMKFGFWSNGLMG